MCWTRYPLCAPGYHWPGRRRSDPDRNLSNILRQPIKRNVLARERAKNLFLVDRVAVVILRNTGGVRFKKVSHVNHINSLLDGL